MSRFIPLLLSAPSLVVVPTTAVSQLPAAPTTSSQDYTPTTMVMVPLDGYLEKIYGQALAPAYAALPDPVLVPKFVDATKEIRGFASWDFVTQYISKAPFYDFGPKLQEVLTKYFNLEAAKFTTPISQIDKDVFVNLVNTEMIAFITDSTVQANNFFEKAKTEKEVTDFVAAVRLTGALDKNKDDSTIIIDAANSVINDLFKTSPTVTYANFLAGLSTFTTQAAFNDAIIATISRSMNTDAIKKSITDDITKEIEAETNLVNDFGLQKMIDNINIAKSDAIKSLDVLTTDLATLETTLANPSSTSTEIKDAVTTFTTEVTKVHDDAINIVKNAVAKEIADVKTEWKAITDVMSSEITYTRYKRLLELLAKIPVDYSADEVLGSIFDSTGLALYKAFVTKWNNGNAPQFVALSKTEDPNDPTKVSFKLELSTKLSANATIAQADKDIYSVSKVNDILVTMDDVSSLIMANAQSLADDSNRLKDISTLDMDNVGKPVDQTNYEPDLLQFKSSEEVLKLIPLLKTLIESDPILKAKLLDQAGELNFDIAIDNVIQQTPLNPAAKVRNYKVNISLSTKTNSDSSGVSSFDIVNIPLFDEKLDNNFASALKNAIEKSNVLNIKTPIDLILGELWKWQLEELQKTNPAATEADVVKGPGKFQFDSIDKLINLLGCDPTLGTLNHVADDKDIAFIDSILKLVIPNGYNTNAFNELRAMFYPGNVVNPKAMADALNALRVKGEIELYNDPVTQELKARLTTLVVQSRRALLESTTLRNIELEIHTFNSEIATAERDFKDMIDYYRPLVDQMIDKGQITQSQANTFWAKVDDIYNKFKQDADPSALDTVTQLNAIKEEAINSFDGAIASFYGNNPVNIKEQLDKAKANAAAAERRFLSMFQTYVTNSNPQLTPDEIKAKLDDIKRLLELRAKELVAKVTDEDLTDQERQEMGEIDARIPIEYKDELNRAFDAEKAKFTIEAVVEFAYEEAAKVEKSDNSLKDIATERIADFLATAKLDNLDELLDLKSFLKEDMLGQKINLSSAMKYALIALGSFMGLVGALTTFSTLRSFKTNKNISQIGDDASISYQKPKKTMAIKGIISIAALGAAASVITLVLTLGGGL